jgi:hypothetical protein
MYVNVVATRGQDIQATFPERLWLCLPVWPAPTVMLCSTVVHVQLTAKIKETLTQMRDTKYTEIRCFHTGVVPELIMQLISPIMLRVSVVVRVRFHYL